MTPAEQHLEWRRYGPSWQAVVTVIETVRTATPEQSDALADAWDAGRDAALDIARTAARVASQGAARDNMWSVVWSAVWSAVRAAAPSWGATDAVSAAQDAARAAFVHDLVGQHGYTAEHEAANIGPYASVFGLPWAEDGSR